MRRNLLIAFGIGAGVLLLVVITAFVAFRTAKRTFEKEITKPQETIVDVGALVTQVRGLNRLETASMRVVHVGTITQSYRMVPKSMAGDEITLMAAGDVIAGFDLSRLQPNDVWREADGTIVMRLPPAQILLTRVDNRETKVVSRKTGVLRRADPGLESRARQHAEQGIRGEAIKQGIIATAQQNGEMRLAELLQRTGVEKVRFEGAAVHAAEARGGGGGRSRTHFRIIIARMAIDLIVMSLARYWSGDYITPAMKTSWAQGLPYAIVRPHVGIETLPPDIPMGGTLASEERRRLEPIVADLQRQIGVTWDERSDSEPSFHRVDPTSFEALLVEARRAYDRMPGLAGRLLGGSPQFSHLGHGTIFVPGIMSEMSTGEGFVVASQIQLRRELETRAWSNAAQIAKETMSAALRDASHARLPLIVDA